MRLETKWVETAYLARWAGEVGEWEESTYLQHIPFLMISFPLTLSPLIFMAPRWKQSRKQPENMVET